MQHFPTYAYDLDSAIENDMKPCIKKPISVSATQIYGEFKVKTLEGEMTGNPGDYLMCGIDGELYPCAKDIFERSYDWG